MRLPAWMPAPETRRAGRRPPLPRTVRVTGTAAGCDTIRIMREVGYRAATTAFVFAGLWFVVGLALLATPIPQTLGIGGQLFAAWLLLFCLILAIAGAILVVASANRIVPPRRRERPRRGEALWTAAASEAGAVRPRTPRGPGGSRSGNPPKPFQR